MIRPALAGGALASALVLTGCGSGQDAQTYEPRYLADGLSVDYNAGAIAVRNVSIRPPAEGAVYEEGSDALVTLTIVNPTQEPDSLIGASSPVAASVDIAGAPDPLVVEGGASSPNGFNLVLRDLSRELATAEYVEITLDFERGGSVTMNVPVEITGEEPEEVEYEVPETDSEGNPLPGAEGEEGEGEEENGIETGSGPDSAAGPEGDSSQG